MNILCVPCTTGAGASIRALAASVLLPLALSATAAQATSGYTDLYTFCSQGSCPDGEYPTGGLVADSSGNLYGTTYGGANGGVVFEVTPNGTEIVLYTFCSQANCSDGYQPNNETLLRDSAGNLYGTTQYGGSANRGTVFKLAPGGTLTTLYSFCSQVNCTDGSQPIAGVVRDVAGNLYGTTSLGGSGAYGSSFGSGTVFKLSPQGTLTTLYSFCSQANCADGETPSGPVIYRAGYLYGTTQYGGSFTNSHCSAYGCGTVFKVSRLGAETELNSFCSQYSNGYCLDGENPMGGVVIDRAGNLYGTTEFGGLSSYGYQAGTVFELTAGGSETTLYTFCSSVDLNGNCTDGYFPEARLLYIPTHNTLVGTTSENGVNGGGTVFSLSGGNLTVLHSFGETQDGFTQNAQGPVIRVNGYGYGITTCFSSNCQPNQTSEVYKVGTLGGRAR